MIKTVLFDLGNVILPFDLLRLATRLAAFSTLSPEEIRLRVWQDHVADQFETGRMSPRDFFEHITKACLLTNLTFEEFIPIFNDIFKEDNAVVALIADLKERYKLGLISNTNAIHVDHLKQTYASLDHFDHLVFSNEAGLRKPDPRIYHLALNHFDSFPQESVFIDDYEPNVESARILGMHGIHYQNVDQLKRELNQIGVTA